MSQQDQEQIENLKRFWQDYGTPIVIGVALAVAVFSGWRYWQNTQLEDATKASGTFQEMMNAVQRSQLNPEDKAASTDVQRLAKSLKDDYSRTPFALNAGLLLSRQAVDRGDFKEAEKQLRWVLEQKPSEAERLLATTRLARVLFAQKQYDAAVALLAKEDDAGFKPTLEELKGDIYQAQGKIPEAQKAYMAAAEALEARGDERRPLLELKMADVGLETPAAKKAAAKAEEKTETGSKSS